MRQYRQCNDILEFSERSGEEDNSTELEEIAAELRDIFEIKAVDPKDFPYLVKLLMMIAE